MKIVHNTYALTTLSAFPFGLEERQEQIIIVKTTKYNDWYSRLLQH